jgi:hypothetical protein
MNQFGSNALKTAPMLFIGGAFILANCFYSGKKVC